MGRYDKNKNGSLEGADVTIKSNYGTAADVSKGELNTQTAFMTGKIKIDGDMGVAMKLGQLLA